MIKIAHIIHLECDSTAHMVKAFQTETDILNTIIFPVT